MSNDNSNSHFDGHNGDLEGKDGGNQSDIVHHDWDEEMQVKNISNGIRNHSCHSDTESTEGNSQNEDIKSYYQNNHSSGSGDTGTEKFTTVISKLEKSFQKLNEEFLKNPSDNKFQVGNGRQRRIWSQVGLFVDRIFFVVLLITYSTVIAFYGSRIRFE